MFVLKTTLQKQEQLFEAKLLAEQCKHEEVLGKLKESYDELHSRHKHVLAAYDEAVLQLNANGKDELTFPKKKFNINKAVTLLTSDLSAKTLATFLHYLVEGLGESHLVTLNQYVLKKLSTNKEKTNGN